ncbi:unnamed protein product [Phaedon cochleariae]|uniref:Sugar transporter n=1 Tax=Phaedon cochleariae TaxID=80249 RepID=A0A9P0GRL1_PHACE|nr:unnamed protein product [Phaedon cochleariae]
MEDREQVEEALVDTKEGINEHEHDNKIRYNNETKNDITSGGGGGNSFLYLSALTSNLLMISCSTNFTWTSPMLKILTNSDPVINPLGTPITPLQQSWFTSLFGLGAVFGPIFFGKLADIIGRKKLLMLLAIPNIAGFSILAVASDIRVYCLVRFVLGAVTGVVYAILPIYLTEISELGNRGMLGSFMSVFSNLGILLVFVIGPYLSVKQLSICCAVPTLLFAIFFGIFIPESPVYLVTKGDRAEATKSLMKLRQRSSRHVEAELHLITKNVEKQTEVGTVGDLFKERSLRRALFICFTLPVFQQISGLQVVNSFLGPILDSTKTGLSTYTSTVIIGIVRMFVVVTATALIDRVGRKVLLLVSTLGCFLTLTLLGMYFHLDKSEVFDIESFSWLPVISLTFFMAFFNVGLVGIPFLLPSELFPPKFKSLGSSLVSFSSFGFYFLVVMSYPIISHWYGIELCFWMFSGGTLLGVVFIYFMVPETKGKTYNDIKKFLEK